MKPFQRVRAHASATSAVIDFVQKVKYAALSDEVRHCARRHLLDTTGVMIAGGSGVLLGKAQAVLATVRSDGRVPVPGLTWRADLLDAAFLGGTAAHGIEFDDGFRQGWLHPGCVVVPRVLALAYTQGASGTELMEAMVAGYETMIAIGAACHPDLRQRGFHPTAVVGVFGSTVAAGKLLRLSSVELGHALGLAASSAAGLFAFVNGSADVKRLHAGHAAREGLQAALLAKQGVQGPPDVLQAQDGFMQAFVGRSDMPVVLPPVLPFGITDCYVKPYPCCRHVQPAIEALIGVLKDENIATEEVQRVDVSTYRVAAAHARTGWDDFASAQLSFPYLMALALKYRDIKLDYFDEGVRRAPWVETIARKVTVSAPQEIDRLYPQLRPARVTVTTARGAFTRQAEEALGSRLLPFDDANLQAKFLRLAGPVLGSARAEALVARLWSMEDNEEPAALIEGLAKPA